MKKHMALVLILSCVLLLSGCVQAPVGGGESASAPKEEDGTVSAEYAEITPQPGSQDMAISAYGQILDSFGGLLPHEPGYPGYPEEFGDAYYEDGYLYICLTENSTELREQYRSLVDTPQILQFREVAYSYNDLYALSMSIKPSEELVLTSWGVNVQENRVDVGIPDIFRQEETLALILESLPQEVKNRFAEVPISFQEESFVLTA